jgi:hypothetical protein
VEEKVWVTDDRNIISQEIHQERGLNEVGESDERWFM